MTARHTPCSRRHGRFCSRWHANLVATYRDERRRQEIEWEGLTGGYAGDAALLRAQGAAMITFGGWLRAYR
jgi:hypothetical protein